MKHMTFLWLALGLTCSVASASAKSKTVPADVKVVNDVTVRVTYLSDDIIRVVKYPGDGAFTLYEDEGDNYNYERGQCTEITFRWNDAARTLTIAPRQGQFKGMLQQRKFRIVIGAQPVTANASATATILYTGEAINHRF